jgi:hypothetical protein
VTAHPAEAFAPLRAPVKPNEVSTLPKGGTLLTYMGHAAVTARLLDCDPTWSWEPFAVDEHGLPACELNSEGYPVGLWIRLTVLGVTRPGYGSVVAKKNESVKELIGDAIRNAAMRFGVGLELWHKGDLNEDTPTESVQRQPRRASVQSKAPASFVSRVQGLPAGVQAEFMAWAEVEGLSAPLDEWSKSQVAKGTWKIDQLEKASEPFGEQTIHPDQGSLEDLVTDAVVGGER